MTDITQLIAALQGRSLPGSALKIETYENAIADRAWLAPDAAATVTDEGVAHPLWFVVASLRGMGISVTELCELAQKGEEDTLLLGSIKVEHALPLRIGRTYRTAARIGDVYRRTARDGSAMDGIIVTVDIIGQETLTGTVTSTYLVKRAR